MYTWGPIQRTAAAPGLTPWFLDTFTAADGTDPTTRTVDVALNGEWDNWRPNGTNDRGEINSNRLELKTGETRSVLYASNNAATDVAVSIAHTILLIADAGTDPGPGAGTMRFSISDNVLEYSAIVMYPDGRLYAEASGASDVYETASPFPNIGSGLHKVALHVESTGVSLIVDGSVIDTYTATGHAGNIAYVSIDFGAGGAVALNGYMDTVAVYSGITLAQATALTT